MIFIFQNIDDEDLDDTEDGENNNTATPIRKGLLWQQRDKLFSQWKERYFILTPDYLQCFKKTSSKITEMMGEFIFKVSHYYYCQSNLHMQKRLPKTELRAAH